MLDGRGLMEWDGEVAGTFSDVAEFVCAVIHAAWTGRFLDYARYLAPDFTWIGALPSQYRLTREQTLEVYGEGSGTIPEVTFLSDSFRVVQSSGALSVVCGSTVIVADPSSGMAYSGRPRTTAVVREVDGCFELVHLHTSHPFISSGGVPGQALPAGISTETVRFLCELCAQHNEAASLQVRDCDGVTHVVRPYEIIYLEADRQYTNLHVIGSSFRVRTGIGDMSSRLPAELFVELRRGTVANIAYVTSWEGGEVRLAGGARVTLPGRRSKEIQDLLTERKSEFMVLLDQTGLSMAGATARGA